MTLHSFIKVKCSFPNIVTTLVRRLSSLPNGNLEHCCRDHSSDEVNEHNLQSVKSQLFVWGLTQHGALGLDKGSRTGYRKSFRYKQKPTRHFFSDRCSIVHVACGFGFSVISVKSRDFYKVYGTGINTDSQIGLHEPRKGHPLETLVSPAPINLGIKSCDTNVISLSAGRAHLAIVTDKEGVFTLGSNCYGQCGRPIIQNEKYCPSGFVHNFECLDGERVTEVVCGQDHTLFLTQGGKVFSCGWGADGQTGQNHNENVTTPTRVLGAIENEIIVKVAGRSDTVLALSKCGEVFGWGNTEYSQLTTVNEEKQFIREPVRLDKLNVIGKIIDVAAGGSFCMALSSTGNVFVWGYGILGLGPCVEHSSEPLRIPPALFGCNKFQPDAKVTKLYCGLNHLAAINNLGNLYTWGRNAHGCLGVGHIRDQFFPYRVCIGSPVSKMSCGVDHTMVICD